MKKNAGFTLIELVIVIIVLGILAATAVPKFINLQDDAKVSALKGAEAAVHSAANIVYSKAAIKGIEDKADQKISDNGTDIKVEFGYPDATANGIGKAIELTGFASATGNTTPESIIFWQGAASTTAPTKCIVTYTEAETGKRYKVETKADCS